MNRRNLQLLTEMFLRGKGARYCRSIFIFLFCFARSQAIEPSLVKVSSECVLVFQNPGCMSSKSMWFPVNWCGDICIESGTLLHWILDGNNNDTDAGKRMMSPGRDRIELFYSLYSPIPNRYLLDTSRNEIDSQKVSLSPSSRNQISEVFMNRKCHDENGKRKRNWLSLVNLHLDIEESNFRKFHLLPISLSECQSKRSFVFLPVLTNFETHKRL